MDSSSFDDQAQPRSLVDILDAVERLAQHEDSVTVEDVIGSLGRASSAALVFLPALIAATPLSGIPGLSAFCGITIALLCAQAVLGRNRLWLPDFVMRRAVDGDKFYQGLKQSRKPLAFLDRHTHRRLSFLTTGLGAKILYGVGMLGGMVMPFLELIPFSASIIAGSVSILMIAILSLDGALVIAAGAVFVLLASGVCYLL